MSDNNDSQSKYVNHGTAGAMGDNARVDKMEVYVNTPQSDKDISAQFPKQLAPSDESVANGGIFISYSRKDLEPYVHSVVKQLYGAGFTLWWDLANIPPGANWRDELDYALKKSTCMVFFMTENSLTSDVCKQEYRYFLNNRKKLFPVMCEMVEVPPSLQGIHYVLYKNIARLFETLKAQCV